MREQFSAKEHALETDVYEIRDDSKLDCAYTGEFAAAPSEFPRFRDHAPDYNYIINLDNEIFTINYRIHWKLWNIPRQDHLWSEGDEIIDYYYNRSDFNDGHLEEYKASPKLKLPEQNWRIGHASRAAVPRKLVRDARKAFLLHVLAEVFFEYECEIKNFGRQWSPDSFPFRELTFAFISIASSQASFRSSARDTFCSGHPENEGILSHTLDADLATKMPPLLSFGSMYHRKDEPAGASPAETMYWFQGVVISLTLVVDGEAITEAADWGIAQGRATFEVVVLSLFHIAFASVSVGGDGKPFIKYSQRLDLGMGRHQVKEDYRWRMGTPKRLEKGFPGLAALVNFLEGAEACYLPDETKVALPQELLGRILDFANHETWRACSLVSRSFRSACFNKYRLDDHTRLVGGPYVVELDGKGPHLAFNIQVGQDEKVFPITEWYCPCGTGTRIWTPVIGGDRKVLMSDVTVWFQGIKGVRLETERDDDVI